MPVFDTDTYEVRELFSQDFVFEFPFYQRPYRWRTEHAATLLDDILAACEGPKELDELPPYFLGSIVLVRRDEDDPRVQVIDGRQRLTTLGILLAVLRDMEGAAKIKSTLHEMLFDEEDELHDIKTGPRLRTGGIDSGYLERFVINPGATTSEVDEEELPERAERIYAVAQLFRRRLSILTDEERGRIRDFVAKHCEIVGVITEDEEQGLRIFQVLNTRGLDLSEVDLIKTDLITSLPSEEQAKAVEAWDNAETLLGAQGMNKLLRVIYSVLTRTISPDDAKNFHERFVKLAKDRNLVELCTVELTDYAELLYQVNNGELPATSLDANPNEAIRALKWLGWDSEDWLPVAVEILIKAKDDSDVAYKGLRGLEVVCYSFFILKGGDRSSRDTRREIFGRVLTELSLGRDVTRPDGALSLPNITRRKMLDALNGPMSFRSSGARCCSGWRWPSRTTICIRRWMQRRPSMFCR